MKSLIKSMLCLMLVLILLLTSACAGGRNESGIGNANGNTGSASGNTSSGGSSSRSADRANIGTGSGRFMEADITPPVNGRFISFLANDGAIVVFDDGLRTRYDSNDLGRTWSQSTGPGAGTDRYMGVQTGAFLQDGSLLVYVQGEGLTAISPDNSSTHFPVAEIDDAISSGENVSVQLIQKAGNDRLLLSYTIGGFMPEMRFDVGNVQGNAPSGAMQGAFSQGRGVQRGAVQQRVEITSGRQSGMSAIFGGGDQRVTLHDIKTGELIAGLPTEGFMAAAAGGGYAYVMDMQRGISSFYIENGMPTGQPAMNLGSNDTNQMNVMLRNIMGGNALAANDHGDLYVLHENSLLHLTNGNFDTLLDGAAFSFGSPSASTTGILSLDDGSIIMAVLANQENRLYRYYWDENAQVNPERTLTIWSLEDNNFIRSAITELRRMYPDSYITYEVALSGDNAVSAADAVRTLNTRLLSGRGPDILVLDGAPAENYINRGMLLDISGGVNTSDIYQNLLAPFLAPDGKIYALPMQFLIPALSGSEAALSEIQSLEALVDKVVNGNPAAPAGPFRLTGIPEDERPELHFNNLEDLFDTMWLANLPAVINNNRLDSNALRQFLSAVKDISDMYGLGAPAQQEGIRGAMVAAFGSGRVNALSGSLMRYLMQSTNLAAFTIENIMILQMLMDREDTEVAPFPGLQEGVWQSSTIVSISADTEVAGFAKQFINTMLSTQVQQTNNGEGLPITRSGLMAQINTVNELFAELGRDPIHIDMDALIARLNAPVMVETTLRDIIWGTVERLCTGRIDLEGAVREIEQSIRNYLAERAQ